MMVLHAHGQTCNKFFTYINYIADSIESGEKIIILAPDITMKHYPNWHKSRVLKFPFYFESAANMIGYNTYIKWLDYVFANRYSLKFLALFSKLIPSVRFVEAATGSYSSPLRIKHQVALKKVFTPHQEIILAVSATFETVRTSYEIICGVHIRHGDYRTWQGGKYYYSEKQYHLLMLNIQKLFSNHSVAFFISSNEKIDLSTFSDCNCFSIPNSNATKDLYGLSISDLIIGPPSTFSGWAAYYGNKHLYFIEDPGAAISKPSFKKISEIWS